MACKCKDKDEEKCGEIVFHERSPYMFVDCNVETESGEKIETPTVKSFCRCGESEKKPFCDGTHAKVKFNGARLKERKHEPKAYVGEKITIFDSRYICCHDGSCVMNLPEVFKMREKPWIDPNGAEAERIIEVIKKCPSGALTYSYNNEKVEEWFDEQKVIIKKDGPYYVQGGVKVRDSLDSNETAITEDHYSLCRCGKSKHSPYCDGSHEKEGFKG